MVEKRRVDKKKKSKKKKVHTYQIKVLHIWFLNNQ